MTAHEELDFATPLPRKVKVEREHGMKVTAAKLKRAKSRDVKQIAVNVWRVSGLKDEAHSAYMVRWDGERGEFTCTCHLDSHGDERARSGCTHDLAVRLTKPNLPSTKGGKDERTGGGPAHPSDDAPTLSLEDPRLYVNDNRGLPHWLKELRPHQSKAILEIEDALNNGADVVFVEAPTGCLAGETELTVNRGGKGFRITIKELYEKSHGRRDNNKKWDLKMPTFVSQGDMSTMSVRSGEVRAVTYSGLQDTVVLRVWDEKCIRLTLDHRVMTESGWREAGTLEQGNRILVNVGRRKRGNTKPKPYYPQVMSMYGHPRAGLRREDPKGGWRVPRHILVVEADMNGLTYEEYVDALKAGESDFKFVTEDQHVHHKDHDSKNFSLDNLVVMSKEEHQRLHGDHTRVAEQLGYRAIQAIISGGPTMTFDIEMVDDTQPHFMAEGIYVHNSGKTIIGELAARISGEYRLYVCSGLELQTQFAKDFQYASMVKGRSNYPTLMPGSWPGVTAADCDKEQVGDSEWNCTWCGGETFNCPYEMAKNEAVRNKLAAVNTTYALTEWNFVGKMTGRDVVVVDEADLLEGEVLSFVEFTIGKMTVRELGLEVPKKGARGTTIESWLSEDVTPAAKTKLAALKSAPKSQGTNKARKRYENLLGDLARIKEAGVSLGDDGRGGWVRVYEGRGRGRGDSGVEEQFTLRPVKVSDAAGKYLWGHGVKWILMSATLVSVDEMVDSLGVDQATAKDVGEEGVVERPVRWEEVHVPAVFPVENRRIIASGVADMTRKGQEAGGVEKLLDGIGVILDAHEEENVLIHTHTYALAKTIMDRYGRRPRMWAYTGAHERNDALTGFKEHGGVLVAPSMDRGIDLPGDECRVQVVCKLPMPYLGDAQISARMKTRGGELWYAAQTARGLIQMTGRAVRSVDDYATTYVLDSTFGKWKRKNKGLLPNWWQDAVTYVPGSKFAGEVERRAEEHAGRK